MVIPLLVVGILLSKPAISMEVFDPMVWIQENQTAISTARTELNTAQMYYTQAMQLANELKQGIVSAATTELIKYSPTFGQLYYGCVTPAISAASSGGSTNPVYQSGTAMNGAQGCLGAVGNAAGSLAKADQQVIATLQNQQVYLQNVQANYGASGVSGQTYAQNLARDANAGNAKAQDLINTNNALNQELAIVAAKRKSIAEQMPNVEGITDSINLTTSAIDNLTELTMAMTLIMKKI